MVYSIPIYKWMITRGTPRLWKPPAAAKSQSMAYGKGGQGAGLAWDECRQPWVEPPVDDLNAFWSVAMDGLLKPLSSTIIIQNLHR